MEIIAEAGVNHTGDLATACALIDAAHKAGADCVKFQLWNTERVYPRERWDEMKRLELNRDQILQLKLYCAARKIDFLCTPDDRDDAAYLKGIGVRRIKIGSSNITNLPMLRDVTKLGLPILLSTGACDAGEVTRAVAAIVNSLPIAPRSQVLTLMHCVSAYPAPFDQMNLRAMTMMQTFGVPVGLSDHTYGSSAAMMALAMGAIVIEKHLTLDRNAEGPDHRASMEPREMLGFIQTLRHCECALGDGRKRVMPCEEENRNEYLAFVERQQKVLTC